MANTVYNATTTSTPKKEVLSTTSTEVDAGVFAVGLLNPSEVLFDSQQHEQARDLDQTRATLASIYNQPETRITVLDTPVPHDSDQSLSAERREQMRPVIAELTQSSADVKPQASILNGIMSGLEKVATSVRITREKPDSIFAKRQQLKQANSHR
jgi:hypothetical protein